MKAINTARSITSLISALLLVCICTFASASAYEAPAEPDMGPAIYYTNPVVWQFNKYAEYTEVRNTNVVVTAVSGEKNTLWNVRDIAAIAGVDTKDWGISESKYFGLPEFGVYATCYRLVVDDREFEVFTHGMYEIVDNVPVLVTDENFEVSFNPNQPDYIGMSANGVNNAFFKTANILVSEKEVRMIQF